MGAVGVYIKKQEDDTMSDVIENMMTIRGNMNIEESMKDYVPITQTYFDVTKERLHSILQKWSLFRFKRGW